MPNFYYKAKDFQGKQIKGVVEASDKKKAISILREKKYFPFFLREKGNSLFQELFNRFFNQISLVEVSNFTRQLATMVNAGLPITEALSILKSQEGNKIVQIAASALRDIEGGSSLAEALKKFPKVFSPVYLALVRAGEAAGVLDKILSRLADNLEAQREFRAKIKGALLYPIIIFVGMALVMFVMMIFVIPKLTSLYTEFNAKLPKATEILISLSNFMVKYWWGFILAIFGLMYGFKILKASKAGRKKLDELIFKIPIVGKLQKQIVLAEFTRTLGLLIGSGVSIMEALDISSKTAGNIIIEQAVMDANLEVEKGFPLASSLTKNPVFPQVLGQMLAVGEETGKVDEVLMKVSHFFQTESEESLKGLTTAIEPLIMIILGVGVGFLIIAIILPIYNLTSQFQ